MSKHDQCPTSAKEGRPALKPRAVSARQVGVTGQAYWRGLDDLADTPDFREFLEREFPAGASELLGSSRRSFLKLMGASVALAGAATIPGCRQPDHKILPYSRNVPEDMIPGKAMFFATSMPLPGGGAEGLLIETHEGRPTKVEGNPLHPANQGKSSLWSQASVLDLYDPDRLKDPVLVREGKKIDASWDDFAAWSKPHFAKFDASKGKGLAIVYDKAGGPTRNAMIEALRAKWPEAKIASFDPLANAAGKAGTAIAFGSPMREVLSIDKAKIILSIDRDFLQFEPGALVNSRGWGASRRVLTTKDSMSRLYSVESSYSLVGAAADHRLALAPSQIPAVALMLAQRVLAGKNGAESKVLADAIAGLKVAGTGIDAKFVDELAKDLLAPENAGKSLIVCGRSQSPAVHAMVAALNIVLGNVGTAVSYLPAKASDAEAFEKVTAALDAGEISTIVVLNANPVYAASADSDFAKKFAKAAVRITLSLDNNETVAASTWQLPAAHYLESWGDTEANDGTIAPTQPMIAPLYAGKSAIEVLAMMSGAEKADGYEAVRAQWRKAAAGADFETVWRRALHDGVLAGSTKSPKAGSKSASLTAAFGAVADAVSKIKIAPAPSEGSLDAAFVVTPLYDGRFANNGWLQELPEAASRVVWDNPALVSPKTAEKLGIVPIMETVRTPRGRMVELKVGGKTMQIAVWAVPGVADNTVILPLGYGRQSVGLVGQGVGFNTFAVRSSDAMWTASGASVKPVEEGERYYPISCTQTHGSMEGRAIVREVDLTAWTKHGDAPAEKRTDAYGRAETLNFAERLEGGELNHMPAPLGIYPNPFNGSDGNVDPKAKGYNPSFASQPPVAPPAFDEKPQWGMSIDLATCTGCNVCTVACQAENNIAVVGKIGVKEGREMHWIRVDRYFKGDSEHATEGVFYQPVACVQCENAPCETVCPVNATVHGSEGHNYMAYNRCIGTRYCANNCPYKVRRFNYFDYGVVKYNGPYIGEETIEGIYPGGNTKAPHKFDPNLIPPRLRKKLDEISKMQKNPNVTVRSRGVMEKCTYCIQRTNEAKIELKLKGQRDGTNWRPQDGLPDLYAQTACQQACPTNSIVFGDILDEKSNEQHGSMVRQMRNHPRSYMLLGFLNTRPRTTYMVGMKNPNPALRKPDDDPFAHHGGSESGGHEGGHAEPAEKHAGLFIDPVKKGRDGYVMSLAVIGERA